MTSNEVSAAGINGILLLNKPEGISSNKALQKARFLFQKTKAGHTGSLDPLATGMLPICFGEATKVCSYLLESDKCYDTTGLLGIKTNTSDSTGEIISKVDNFTISEEQLKDILLTYQGEVLQKPSMFSALKHQGKPLYHYARKGIEISREKRPVHVKEIRLTNYDGLHFSLRVQCSKGTYIRNLVEDIGDTLGVGAHVTRLHRHFTSGFEHLPMYSLETLDNMTMVERIECLLPMDKAIEYLSPLTLSKEDAISIQQGRVLPNIIKNEEEELFRLYNEEGHFIGIGVYIKGQGLKAKRLLSTLFEVGI